MHSKSLKLSFFLICISLLVFTPLFSLADNSDSIGIGGGGVFLHCAVNPTDSHNLFATSDMGGLYFSTDNGASWQRSETNSSVASLEISSDGVLFVGEYGLYNSFDKGKSLNLIYPKNVKYSVSRMGTGEKLFLADEYTNSIITSIATYNGILYFSAHDWYGNFRIFSSTYTGDNLTLLYEGKTKSAPKKAVFSLFADEYGIMFADENNICKIENFSVTTLYSTSFKIKDFTKIGNTCIFLEERDETQIICTENFITYENLTDKIPFPQNFTKWGKSFSFKRHFDQIAGNNLSDIYFTFNSHASGYGDMHGIVKYNGTSFEWVYDNVFNPKKEGLNAWTYNTYGPMYGICTDKNNDCRILAANIETVFDITYSNGIASVSALHCNPLSSGGYATTGLDCQSTHSVRVDPFDENHILIPSSDMGLQYSFDNGASFEKVRLNGNKLLSNCYDVYFDQNTKDLVYGIWSSVHGAPYDLDSSFVTSDIKGGFAVSFDGGITWDFSISTGIPENSIPVRMSVYDNDDSLTIAVATFNQGFFLSYDSGKTFYPINFSISSYDGRIFGIDTLVTPTAVYCLTSHYNLDEVVPSMLYKYSITEQSTTKIDLGSIVIAKSLTYNPRFGILLNVIPYYRYQWMKEFSDGYWVNYGGGIYKISDEGASLLFEEYDGIMHSAFSSDGTLYAIGVYGKLFRSENNSLVPIRTNLFNSLKNVFIFSDNLYITTRGGGTHRISLNQKEG